MSESRDRAMRRSRGTSRNVIDGKVKLERARSAGQHQQVVFPSTESVKEAVLAGICPCCGGGPFALLARHTHAQHGIDTRQLRDLAGLTYSESITPASLRERRSQMATSMIADGRWRTPGGKKGAKPQRSVAGRELMKRKPGTSAPACINCGEPARRKQSKDRSGSRWLKTCSETCAREASRKARTKERPTCVVCGASVPFERGRPSAAKTCSDKCLRQRLSAAMSERRRRQIQSAAAGPVRPREEPTP